MKQIRQNCVEGQFYPDNSKEQISLFKHQLEVEKERINYELASKTILGGVVPHAGHVYCGKQAIHFFEIVKASKEKYDVIILVNPSHKGSGFAASIDEHKYWKSSLGEICLDEKLVDAMGLPLDSRSQAKEHSGEVILPYIQYFIGNDIPILPINFSAQNNDNAKLIAQNIFDVCKQFNKRPLIIASSDFNHFASAEEGAKMDDFALSALFEYDPSEFERRIRDKNISICGFGAILVLYYYCKLSVGAFDMKILSRGNSGEIYPSENVVDYISMLFYKDY
ncbi:MAG: AmmeMemoRadiSam system protein B [Bacteroidales bacterium]